MSTDITRETSITTPSWSALDRLLRGRLIAQMRALQGCRLTLRDALGEAVLGTPAAPAADTLHVRLEVRDAGFYRALAAQGSVGAGEAYMDGLWHCDDLVALVRILVRNRALSDAVDSGTARLADALLKGWHALRRNTRSGSRRNIAAHYDLGNPLFKLFLSGDLMYSSAVYAREDETLEAASLRKLDRICRKLELKPTDHVVEIGTGWGGFALHAASRYGCRVTTTTISREQYGLARERVAAAGLGDHIEVLLKDYRDLEGSYDKLVSIEMVEAIGHQYLETYFAAVARLLKGDGMALVQAITIEDHRYRQALQSVDFIKRFIFPGSFIPALSALLGAAATASDLRAFNVEDIGPSYALTLKAWRERFLARLPEVRALGYDERFIRMWEFYLAYCEGGFRERSIGDVQLLLVKPGCRRPQWLPDLADAG
ncbi:MAG TPA: cyclopropane-fatty-acyl-phospholipid synthase family protein [Rhodanobacteraceae bacterium]|nr:cyclopropane-fatty-acyl-phospholipid synthase family protein [Rhodanobacteraceae bacterium]